MIVLKRILVPIDFSDFSERAFDYAAELAAKFAAELHLLHVVDDYSVLAPEAFLSNPEEYRDNVRKGSEQRLNEWAAGKAPSAARTVVLGKPFVEIVRYAREHQIDLIVIGSHGRTGLSHMLLGSVAENVVRKASCPVLTVRTGQHGFVMP